jgi:hypothetical protein
MKTPVPTRIIPGGARFLDPVSLGSFLLVRKEEALPSASISEIHRFPLRPEGFLEPLFPTSSSKRMVAEHLLEAPWLMRASELEERAGQTARVSEEPVRLEVCRDRAEVVRSCAGRRCSWRRSKVLEVLECWREVKEWWEEDRHTDRLVFRVLLCGGAVVDLARERFGGWSLVGMVD